MTGDDDDDPVVVVGSSDSSDSPIPPDHPRLFSVAPSLTVWDFFQSFPGISLEIGTIDRERYSEFCSLSFEIFSELSCCEREDLVFYSNSLDCFVSRNDR